jgi:hypothetical protein
MTLAGQVLHLVRRELRGIAPWLVLMGLVLIVAVVRSTESTVLGSAALPTSIVIMLCLALASAMRVMADSPARADAYWATQPIDARALAVAKLLACLCVTALCGVAMVITMHDWGYSLTTAVTSTVMTVAGMTVWSLGVAVVASACAQRALAWSVVGSLVLMTQLFGERLNFTAHLERGWVALATCTSLAVGAIALIAIYRRRPERSVHRVGAIALGGLLLVSSTIRPPSRSGMVASRTGAWSSFDSDSVTLQLSTVGQPECEGQWIFLPLDILSPAWARVELTRPRTTLILANGDSVALVNTDWMQSVGIWGSLVTPALFPHTLDDETSTGSRRVRRADIGFVLPAGQRDRVCGRVTRIDLRVQQRSATGVELMRVPLVVGAAGDAPGVRVRVREVGRAKALPTITAEIASLVSLHGRSDVDVEGIDFALWHQRSGTAIRLEYQGGDGLARAADLQGLSRMSRTQRIGVERSSKRLPTGLKTMENMQLVVVAPVWRPRKERRVTADVSLPLAVMQSSTAAHQ